MVDNQTADPPFQVDINFKAFQAKLPEFAATHAGKLALMHDGEIVGFFDSYADAVRFGIEKFSDFNNFSIQEVTNQVATLGFYSHAAVHVCQ